MCNTLSCAPRCKGPPGYPLSPPAPCHCYCLQPRWAPHIAASHHLWLGQGRTSLGAPPTLGSAGESGHKRWVPPFCACSLFAPPGCPSGAQGSSHALHSLTCHGLRPVPALWIPRGTQVSVWEVEPPACHLESALLCIMERGCNYTTALPLDPPLTSG